MSIRFSQFGWQVVSNDGLPVYRGTLHGCLSYVEGLQAEWAQLAGIARQANPAANRNHRLRRRHPARDRRPHSRRALARRPLGHQGRRGRCERV